MIILDWMNKVSFSAAIKLHLKNILYILIWAVVSLVSSFNEILEWDFGFFNEVDFYCGIAAPLLIWIVAFFADYIYTISMIQEGQELDKSWTRYTYMVIMCIFMVLVISTFHHETVLIRLIWCISLFVCIVLLKTASLYVIRTTVNLKAV